MSCLRSSLKKERPVSYTHLGRPEASLEEVVEAAKAAHAHSFIKRLPEGYDTVISEDGGKTSSWAVGDMKWAVGAGMIYGRENNTLAPGGTATRAEVAQIRCV